MDLGEFSDWFDKDGPALLAEWKVSCNARVLDYGCGYGTLTIPLAGRCRKGTIIAADQCSDTLAILKKELDKRGLEGKAECVCSSDSSLSFIHNNSLDVIFLFDVIQHVENVPGLLEACCCKLVEDGRIILNPGRENHPGEVEEQHVCAALEAHGFYMSERKSYRVMHYKRFADNEIWFFKRVTPFQKCVYDTISCIPKGKVMTYKNLAEAVGCNSNQAVGQALRKNPFAPRVPCHRVVASDGTLGGFSGFRSGEEIERKQHLLENEGVRFVNGKISDDGCYVTCVDKLRE